MVAINGEPVDGWMTLVNLIPEAASDGRPVQIEISRDGMKRELEIVPELVDGRMIIGVRPGEPGPERARQWNERSRSCNTGPWKAWARRSAKPGG